MIFSKFRSKGMNQSRKSKTTWIDTQNRVIIACLVLVITGILSTAPAISATSSSSETTTTSDESSTPAAPPEEAQGGAGGEEEVEVVEGGEEDGGPTGDQDDTTTNVTVTETPLPTEPGPLVGPNATAAPQGIQNESATVGTTPLGPISNQTMNQTLNIPLQNTTASREIAETIGELHNQGLAELQRIDNETQGNDTKETELILQNLTQENLLTPSESQDVERIFQLLSPNNNNLTNAVDLINSLSSINNQLIEENASPLAIALSDIAVSSAQYWSDQELGNATTGGTGPSTEREIKFCDDHPRFCKIIWKDILGCGKGLLDREDPDWEDCLRGAIDGSLGASQATLPTSSEPSQPGSTESVIGSNATTTPSSEDEQSDAGGAPQETTTTERARPPIGSPTNCTFPPCPGEEEPSSPLTE
jgi:hypothetical protein